MLLGSFCWQGLTSPSVPLEEKVTRNQCNVLNDHLITSSWDETFLSCLLEWSLQGLQYPVYRPLVVIDWIHEDGKYGHILCCFGSFCVKFCLQRHDCRLIYDSKLAIGVGMTSLSRCASSVLDWLSVTDMTDDTTDGQ